MTDASIKQKALTTANVLLGTDRITLGQLSHQELMLALVHVVEQSEAFRQEVSDTLEEYKADQPYVWEQSASDYFDRFIIPKPKPDPLVGVLDDLGWFSGEEEVGNLRSALEARGLEIREKGR